ncbi:NAD(P)/FAD-dependent oxidoreductase [Nocardia sp. CDC153]|uniref:FAD-dependent oxidoreductase n=1 Tax=Nocardia sp. CDC153 TaxID=3112167 RepID=UPI002DB7DA91|nr:NAD(P)/FAD-dependent oxidoreductase [Nocardia sp. CDC153]MEC3953120.1 NAD(P)/FAD-dependent oxidoreductase [Nocardia sp. CDC153]
MTRALIIGSGVAGPVLSMALQQADIESRIFEGDAAGVGEDGSWLNFQSANGIDALRAIDAAGPVEKLGYEVETMSFANSRGRSLGRMPIPARPDGLKSMMVPRAALREALDGTARERGIAVEYGKTLRDVVRLPGGGVQAVFADGSTADGDLLIGCDGVHSTVRTLIDPDAPAPGPVPVLTTGGYIPDFTIAAPERDLHINLGTRCSFAWLRTPDGGTAWFANPPKTGDTPDGVLSDGDDAALRRWLHEIMAGETALAHDIVDAAPAPLFGWSSYTLPVARRWHDNHGMVIIGDAAHVTSPTAGQGLALAIEDAVVLAQCLRDCPDVPTAFTTFEALRRDRVTKIVKHGRNPEPPGAIGRFLRDLMMPVILGKTAKDGGKSLMWIQGHHIDFDARVIPVTRSDS